MNIKLKYLSIVFFTGVCVTALEIASARLISPFFGSTIYVWGGAIGTALLALAIGYWLGGTIIDRMPTNRVLSAVLFLSAVTTLLIPWMYQATTKLLSQWSAAENIPVAVGVMVSMSILFFIPLMAMGMVSPMALKLSMSSVEKIGSWSGALSGVATFGSIIGTFASAYGTIPLLGTRWTIYASGAILFILSVFIAALPKRVQMLGMLLLLLTGINIAIHPFIPRSGLAAEKESAYQLVQVIEQEKTRLLIHDAGLGVQSLYTPGIAYTNSPYDVFGLLPYLADNPDDRRSVLLLGLGGGNIVRLYEEHLAGQFTFDITAVEIDPVVVDMANQYFDLEQLTVNVAIDDARHFLRFDKQTYDIIIIDAYTHETQIPVMLATREFFQQTREHLSPGGVLGINALAFPESRFLPKFLSTIKSIYPDVREATFTPGALNHFVIAGESLDVNQVPAQLDPILQPFRDSALVRLKAVEPGTEFYTDNRSDLDLRVKPFLE